MCSISEENSSLPAEILKKDNISIGQRCDKCSTEPAVIALRENDVSCRSCFLHSFTHKFRAILGKSRMIKTGEKILLSYSGGAASSALLQLVKEGFEEPNHKKFRFIPGILYIEDGSGVTQHPQETNQTTLKIIQLAIKYGFPVHVTSLENVFKHDLHSGDVITFTPGSEVSDWTSPWSPSNEFQTMLGNVKTLTSKQDLVLKLRYDLMCKVALSQGYSKVFMGDTGQGLAVQLLTNLAQGQGTQMPMTIGFADTRRPNVTVLRPMSEFVAKEICMYTRCRGVEFVSEAELDTMEDSKASIRRLTETFVYGLQSEFPGTVSTVFRTGNKLGSGETCTDSERRCVLCQAVLDTHNDEASAVDALKVSRELSERSSAPVDRSCCGADSGVNRCGSGEGQCCMERNKGLATEDVTRWLCYSCRLIANDTSTVSSLPSFVLDECRRRTARLKMKAEIAGFLLDDDSGT